MWGGRQNSRGASQGRTTEGWVIHGDFSCWNCDWAASRFPHVCAIFYFFDSVTLSPSAPRASRHRWFPSGYPSTCLHLSSHQRSARHRMLIAETDSQSSGRGEGYRPRGITCPGFILAVVTLTQPAPPDPPVSLGPARRAPVIERSRCLPIPSLVLPVPILRGSRKSHAVIGATCPRGRTYQSRDSPLSLTHKIQS